MLLTSRISWDVGLVGTVRYNSSVDGQAVRSTCIVSKLALRISRQHDTYFTVRSDSFFLIKSPSYATGHLPGSFEE